MPRRALAPGVCGGALGVAALLLAATGACAPPPVACSGRIDPVRSTARFAVDVRLPMRAEGRFTEIAGELTPAADGGCDVRVRLRTDTVAYEGPDWMASLTRSPAFLDAATHPDAAFESQPFPAAWLNDGGPIRGRLRLRGRERPVEFTLRPAECDRPGQACDIRVQGAVNRRDFGMQAYRFTVKDTVRFEFAIRVQVEP